MSHTTLITDVRHFEHPQEDGAVSMLIRGRHIEAILPAGQERPGVERVINAEGRLAIPGLIDLHIHGAGGVDTLSHTAEEVRTMSTTLARLGTTGYLATALVLPDGENSHLSNLAKSWEAGTDGARLLGLHLEGPFVNPDKRGGMFEEAVHPPSLDSLKALLDLTRGGTRMMTIATELDEEFRLSRHLMDAGVIPSLGHTNATYEETGAAIDAGITHITHLFNAMPPLHHRNPGPLLAIIESQEVTVQLINDGLHVRPEIVRWIGDVLGHRRIIGITDGMQAMGLPPGRYTYRGREFETENGTASYLNGTLIGTTRSLLELMLNYQRFTGCTLPEAVHSVTSQPARVLGIEDHKGSLEAGKDADIVLLNDDRSVWLAMVEGEVVFRR